MGNINYVIKMRGKVKIIWYDNTENFIGYIYCNGNIIEGIVAWKWLPNVAHFLKLSLRDHSLHQEERLCTVLMF